MVPINRAIMLLAGRGRRMGECTDNCPKALLDIGQTSILGNALQVLSASGVEEIVLIVGYKANLIQDTIGSEYESMRVNYVVNPHYSTTNTAYSLWLAREWLDTTSFVIEGDIIFTVDAIKRIRSCHKAKGVWAVVPVAENRDEGILLEKSTAGNVSQVALVRDPGQRTSNLNYKCAGIQLVSGALATSFSTALDEEIGLGKNNMYADLILSSILEPESMSLCSLDGLAWAEIDTCYDLERAKQLMRQQPTA